MLLHYCLIFQISEEHLKPFCENFDHLKSKGSRAYEKAVSEAVKVWEHYDLLVVHYDMKFEYIMM